MIKPVYRSAMALSCAAIFFTLGAPGAAQVPAQAGSPNANVRAGGDAETGDQYLIGTGDVLDVRVFNRPQLSREAVRVDGRGMISLPLIGEIKANCLTESRLARVISDSYLEYLRNPNVEVFIKDYQSKPVMVIGSVRDPGRFQMQRRVRLVELISLAGGPTDQAGGRVQVKHAPEIATCAESADVSGPQPTAGVEWFDLHELLREDPSGERTPYMRPGDVVNVLEADKIFVVGNVGKPTTIPLKEPITISKAVASAGGSLPDSKLESVRILRQVNESDTTRTELIVNLRAINRQQAEDVALQANDIVDVPTSNGKRFLRGLVNSIAPTIMRGTVRAIP